MRREDTIPFLADFLSRRAAPLLDAFRNWSYAHALLRATFAPKADHLSYKCREVREYDELRSRFEEYADGWSGSRFLHQTIISGRRVAAIGLVDPIPTPFGDIRLLELAEPKPMSAERYGYDHVEICPANGTVDDMAEALNSIRNTSIASRYQRSIFVKKGRPHHTTWDADIVSFKYGADFVLRLTDGPLVGKIGIEML